MNLRFFETYLKKEFKGILPSNLLISNSFARDKERYSKRINGVDFDVVYDTNNLDSSWFSIDISVNKDVSFILTVFYDWATKKPFNISMFSNNGSLMYYGYMYFYNGSFENLKVKEFERYIQFLKVLLKINK